MIIVTLSALFFLPGCSTGKTTFTPSPQPTVRQSPGPTQTSSSTPIASAVPSPTAEVVIPTYAYTPARPSATKTSSPSPKLTISPISTNKFSTFSPTPTQTATPAYPLEAKLKVDCLAISPNLPPEAKEQGVVVLKGYGGSPDALLNMVSWDTTAISDAFNFVVSPDGKWLAYINGSGDPSDSRVIIINADGRRKGAIPFGEGWFGIAQWLDNERLIITRRDEPVFATIVLNPFTGERKEVLPKYPDIYRDYPPPLWGDNYSYSESVYDPMLTRVVYPRDLPRAETVLWDISNGQALASLFSVYPFGHTPKWTLDGQRFVMSIEESENWTKPEEELYSVTRDGLVTRLTYLTLQFVLSQ